VDHTCLHTAHPEQRLRHHLGLGSQASDTTAWATPAHPGRSPRPPRTRGSTWHVPPELQGAVAGYGHQRGAVVHPGDGVDGTPWRRVAVQHLHACAAPVLQHSVLHGGSGHQACRTLGDTCHAALRCMADRQQGHHTSQLSTRTCQPSAEQPPPQVRCVPPLFRAGPWCTLCMPVHGATPTRLPASMAIGRGSCWQATASELAATGRHQHPPQPGPEPGVWERHCPRTNPPHEHTRNCDSRSTRGRAI
jgi:hypothetical protein